MRRGFTMIEMLLATMLVGMITALSVMTFNAVTRGWQGSTNYLDKMQRTDYALNQVVSGLRSMYYSHDGKINENYGFVLVNNGDGDDPDKSDIITWSKTGQAIVGTKNAIADTVHRVQVMILEEGKSNDWDVDIQKTGLYARLCGDAALIPKYDNDDTDYTFSNPDLYKPVLISDGISGFNCRVIKKAEDEEASGGNDNENDKKKFEDEFAESNSVPYKVELTFFVDSQEEGFLSSRKRAPLVRIVKIPIHEQSLDGATPPGAKDSKTTKGNKTTTGSKNSGGELLPPGAAGGGPK